ncbi:MAG: LLM class flavin-dependent oxidoreductase [Crocinitomicaceae bacterium]|nr:LLM class flavin-dependent oxidoreductase [Flavobacteriales bacterium]NQZ34187.1 LLM class flavin-dependent oxidoreductase [Crocinitomicaceae bacterium]
MKTSDNIHFHWRLIQTAQNESAIINIPNNANQAAFPDLKSQGEFCKIAEDLGIESVLVDINHEKPDPTILATALSRQANEIGFIIAVRSGLLSPTLFTQQINTLSTLSKNKIYLNVVAGHSPAEQATYGDFLNREERYERTDDFLNICTQFWNNNGSVDVDGKYIQVEKGLLKTPFVSETSKRPFIFVAGGGQPTIDLTLKYGDCWMQLGNTVEYLQDKLDPVLSAGKSVGLRFSVICRETNEEAVIEAQQLLKSTEQNADKQKSFITKSDSESFKRNFELSKEDWPAPNLWMGAVKTVGPTGIAIVGSYEEVAQKIMEYKAIGVSHFIFSAWSKQEEMIRFGTHVMPLIRTIEKSQQLIEISE